MTQFSKFYGWMKFSASYTRGRCSLALLCKDLPIFTQVNKALSSVSKISIFLCLFTSLSLLAVEPIIRPDFVAQGDYKKAMGSKAMVVCQDKLAGKLAVDIIKNGGNAADAAVALAYTLAVTQPKAGNLGGGGFALYYDAKSKKTVAIDFREMAPIRSNVKDYLNAKGEVDKQKIRFSAKACGVPGTVAGLEYLRENFGTLSRDQLLNPAHKLAKNGFPVSKGLANDLQVMANDLKKDEYVRRIFYPQARALREGELLVQSDLAKTLKLISEQGRSVFYEGEVAQKFCAWHGSNGGFISLKDMRDYRVRTLEPIKGTYRGYEVYSMPPPSSGGVHLIQMLNILEAYDLRSMGHNSAEVIHLLSESMKYAYADRSKYLGDPDFNEIPIEALSSKKYAEVIREGIDLEKARPSASIKPGEVAEYESPDTTHFSIADQEGNVLSLTYTINFSFGCRLMVPGLGFFLNNEMDDFSLQPGVPNAYGLIGGKANELGAGKRPLSSMTPTIVFKDKKPFLVTGSPGGSRIITTVLQMIINVIDFDLDVAQATMAARIHHQWLPDRLSHEVGFKQETLDSLNKKGQNTALSPALGCLESIIIRGGKKSGFADPRRLDGSAEGL